MVHGKWIFYTDELDDVKAVLSKVYDEHIVFTDEDIYGFNIVVYENETPVSCGRLNYNDEKFTIGRLCTIPEKRGMAFADLALRMLVRKAFDMGAESVSVKTPADAVTYFERLNFKVTDRAENEVIMTKFEDVGGCCKI